MQNNLKEQASVYQEPYLIQRIEKPFDVAANFDLGVGVGGSNESRKLIKGFCHFDYMGSAEFEFGTVAEAMEGVGKACLNFVKFDMTVEKTTVYGFCHSDKVKQIKEQILRLAKDAYRLKESSYFNYAIGTGDGTLSSLGEHIVGWLDIGNLAMWFIDRKMFETFCRFYKL